MRKIQLDWQGYYTLDERTIRDKVDDRAGVYKVSRKQKDGSLKPFYTGQAASVKMRLLEHATSSADACIKEQLAKGDCQFRFAYLYTRQDLDAAEKALYRRYTPRCSPAKDFGGVEDVEANCN